jgi:preprotein translocase subunit SecB
MTKKPEVTTETQANNPEFAIQRLYVKDLSFEAPSSPEIYQMEWKPEVNLDLNINSKDLSNDMHEVAIKIMVTVKLPQKTAFIAEVEQAGIFTIKNFPADQLKAMLGSFCPNILFPYAREAVSDLVVRGGFPPLYLTPINFDALYQQQLEEEAKKKG